MPDPGTAIIGGLGAATGLYGASKSSSAATSAAQMQADAANQAAQIQYQMFQESRQDMAPWVSAGKVALGKLVGTGNALAPQTQGQAQPQYAQSVYDAGGYWSLPEMRREISGWQRQGHWDEQLPDIPIYSDVMVAPSRWVPVSKPATAPVSTPTTAPVSTPATAAGTGTAGGQMGLIEQGPGEFKESPSYQFALEEGMKGIQRMASATGRLGSGASMKAASRYAEDLASQEYDNFLRRYYESLDPWFTLAGHGQVSAGQSGANALATGRGVASTYLSRGEAQAAGQLGGAYPWSQLANYGAGQGLNYAFNRMNQPQNYLTNAQHWAGTAYTPWQANQMGWL